MTGTAGADPLSIMTENYPPLNYQENGKLTGPAVDIVREIQKKLGLGNEIKVYPWKRGYHFVQTKTNQVLFAMTRTEKRETMFKWVGPLAVKKYVFFADKNTNLTIGSLKAAMPYKVGVQTGGVTEEFLRSQNFPAVETVADPSSNLKKLLAGRLDLWYDTNSTMAMVAKKKRYINGQNKRSLCG